MNGRAGCLSVRTLRWQFKQFFTVRLYQFNFVHIVIAAIWTLHNDVIDYVFGQMPIYFDLMKHMDKIGYFTFWLSIACIVTCLQSMEEQGKMSGIE